MVFSRRHGFSPPTLLLHGAYSVVVGAVCYRILLGFPSLSPLDISTLSFERQNSSHWEPLLKGDETQFEWSLVQTENIWRLGNSIFQVITYLTTVASMVFR